MPSKRDDDDALSRSDLDTIIEVNKKAIEVQIEVASQNEKIIEDLDTSKKISENVKRDTESLIKDLSALEQDIKDYKKDVIEKIDDVKKKVDDLDKSQFKIYALLTTGAIAVILQIIQLFLNWKK